MEKIETLVAVDCRKWSRRPGGTLSLGEMPLVAPKNGRLQFHSGIDGYLLRGLSPVPSDGMKMGRAFHHGHFSEWDVSRRFYSLLDSLEDL